MLVIIKFLKTSDKEKILKGGRQKIKEAWQQKEFIRYVFIYIKFIKYIL